MTELILADNPNRFVIYPITYDRVWKLYKDAVASIWFPEEADLVEDVKDWETKLTKNEQYFIKHILAFFASADGIVNENLACKFYTEVTVPEIKAFYAFQMFMESIHNETYSLLIDTLIKNEEEKSKLFCAITEVPAVKKKAEWALKWINNNNCFAERLLAFACVECIMFCGSFCAIFWLKKRGLMPGLTFLNELISRDESIHVMGAALFYSMLQHKLPQDDVYNIVREAVEHEKEFIQDAIPVSLIGMNAVLMIQYIEYVADYLLHNQLGYEKLYHVSNPFLWMELISLQGKTNFFERRVSDYQKEGINLATKRQEGEEKFTMDAEF